MTTTETLTRLETVLETMLCDINTVGVAVSGGVDSMTLAFVTHRLFHDRAQMLHAVSPAVAPDATGLPMGGSVVVAPLERGFVLPASRLAVLTESEATGRRRTRRRTRPRRQAAVRVFEDLAPGDYVGHEQPGVARFHGPGTRRL